MIFFSPLIFREDLLNNQSDPNDEQFFNSFVILSIHYLVGGLARGLDGICLCLRRLFVF